MSSLLLLFSEAGISPPIPPGEVFYVDNDGNYIVDNEGKYCIE